MDYQILKLLCSSSFHVSSDLSPLVHMITTLSRALSSKARLRLAWMDSYRECGNAALVCRHFCIPLRTFWRWYARYDPWDLTSLEAHSRKPHHSPRRTEWDVERRVLAVKRAHPRWGREKIALILRNEGHTIAGQTVGRILKRHSLIVHYRTRKRRTPKSRVDWALVKVPGDLVQVDTKHVVCNGRKVYQYTLIDVISRVRYADIYPRATMVITVAFLKAAQRQLNMRFAMLQTDNGSEFGKAVSQWCHTQSIRHVFSHKKRPQENAYVERSHRSDEEEFYSLGQGGATLPELKANFARYLAMYNTERPHWGLGGKTPEQALNNYLTNQTVPHVLT